MLKEFFPFLYGLFGILFGSFVGFFITHHWRTLDKRNKKEQVIEDEKTELLLRVVALEKQLEVLSHAVTPISTAFQAILINELTHLSCPETDALLEKIGPPNILTVAEKMLLFEMLEKRAMDIKFVGQSERDAAVMLPYVMRRVEIEEMQLKTIIKQFRFVNIPIPLEDK